MNWDYHYWLQRGSLEVEVGDLELATNFIDQARSLNPDDRMVRNEYGYLLMKKASRNPFHASAREWFEEGKGLLEDLISQYGKQDSYPYHVLGSQGLAWARQAALPLLEKRALLRHLIGIVNAGIHEHPRWAELRPLAEDLKKDWLNTTTGVYGNRTA